MKELVVLSAGNENVGKQKLPVQFDEVVRPDLIKRAVLAIESRLRQPYGSDPRAGKKASAVLSRRRRKYKGSYGKGISRVPRKTLLRRGMQMIWVGAFAPGTVGGRRAHPPQVRDFAHKINAKERKKAIRSALAAAMDKATVSMRGHKVPDNYPFVLASDCEKISKTKDLRLALEKLGLLPDLERGAKKNVRAGKGTMRSRPYKRSKGPLLVVSGKCEALRAARNIPGVDVAQVSRINAKLLAPGAHPGRLTLFTQAALEKIENERLFL